MWWRTGAPSKLSMTIRDRAGTQVGRVGAGLRSGYKWILVAVLFVTACLNYADRAALTAVFPILRKELGMSDVALAATSSLFLWSYALFSPLAGYMGDRFSRSSVIAWSLAVWSVIVILNGLARTPTELLLMRVPLGIAESIYIPAAIALIADHHSTSTRGRAFSIHLCGFYAGLVVGSSLAGYLGERYGWRCPLFVLGVAGLLFAGFSASVLRDGPVATTLSEEPRPVPRPASLEIAAALREILRVRTYWFLMIEAFLLSAVSFVLITWLPLFFHEAFGMDLAEAGFRGTFALQCGSVLGMMLGGLLSDRVGKKTSRRRMLIQVCCDFLSAPMLLFFLFAPNATALQLILLLFSFVLFMGGANSNPLACDLFHAEHRSLAFGIMNLTSCLSAGAGVVLSGALKARFTLPGIFASVSVIGLLGGFALLAGYYFFLRGDLRRSGVEAMRA